MPSSSSHNGDNKNENGASTSINKDLCKAFDKRFKHFTFTSIPPKLEAWEGSGIVNKVFDEEYNIKNFKSSQEQLTWRIETWIDKCRIHEVDENGDPLNKSSGGKFHSAKRFRNKTSNNNNNDVSDGGGGGGAVNNALSKVRSLSSAFSKSIENLYRHHDVKLEEIETTDEFQYATETRATARIAPSKSTNDLLDTVDKDDGGNRDDFSSRKLSTKDDFYHDTTTKTINNKSNKKRANREKYRTLELPRKISYNTPPTPPKNRFNKLLGSVAGKLKPTSSNHNSNNNSNINKKNRNSMDADLFLRQRQNSESSNNSHEQNNSYHNQSNNNNKNNDKDGKKPSKKPFRPSVLDFVRNINSKENKRNRAPTEYEKRPHTIARSTSVAARSTPSPCEYQQYEQYEQQTASSSHTLFKSRRHNDSVKRFKNKSTGIRPQSAGPYTSSQVFFDPKNELCGDSPSVRKEMGQV